MNDFSLPRKTLESLIGLKGKDFDMMIHNSPDCRESEDGFPVFKILKYFVDKSKETFKKLVEVENLYDKAQEKLSEFGEGSLEGPTETNLRMIEKEILDNELKKHKIMKERVVIETSLSLLIPKGVAESRSKKLLNTIATEIVEHINNAAELIVEMTDSKDYRSVKTLLGKEYNKTVDMIYEKAENLTWAEDGDSQALQLRLDAVKFSDPEFERVYNTLYGGANGTD